MKCPVDGETLVMADRSGVEIDYCPKCRGVWLDRGELDKIIERASSTPTAAPRDAAPIYQPEPGRVETSRQDSPREDQRRRYDNDDDQRRRYDNDEDRYHGKKKRRESFLSDLFDF